MKLENIIHPSTYASFVKALEEKIDNPTCVKKSIIMDVANVFGIDHYDLQRTWFKKENRVSYGYYCLPMAQNSAAAASTSTVEDINNDVGGEVVPFHSPVQNSVQNSVQNNKKSFSSSASNNSMSSASMTKVQSCTANVPKSDPCFIPWGNYADLKKIIASGLFFPTYISGPAGNGKSLQIKNICAQLKRKYIRVQMTAETTTDDLIGMYRLNQGEMLWVDGPVIVAMKEGAVLLLDETDRAGSSLLELQGVLEGEPVLVKKTGEIVEPADGFTVMATGNTKGRGDDSGRYNFAQIIDEAFLERFVIDVDQAFPKKEIIEKILQKFVEKNQSMFLPMSTEKINAFVIDLTAWGTIINETFEKEAIDETISIRRLVHALKSFGVFKNEKKAIQMTINRFDETNRDAFFDLFKKVTKLENIDQENDQENDQGNEAEDDDYNLL